MVGCFEVVLNIGAMVGEKSLFTIDLFSGKKFERILFKIEFSCFSFDISSFWTFFPAFVLSLKLVWKSCMYPLFEFMFSLFDFL